jgi:hypothetical protein
MYNYLDVLQLYSIRNARVGLEFRNNYIEHFVILDSPGSDSVSKHSTE